MEQLAMNKIYKIFPTPEYEEWLSEETQKSRLQIEDRLLKISRDGYFGDHKEVDPICEIWELKWKNGRRIYYAHFAKNNLLLLLGGNKNGQTKDITKAKNILRKNTSHA